MKLYSFIFWVLLSMHVFAGDFQKMYILHINGIQTTHDEAEANTKMLMQTAQINSNMVISGVVYNPTGDHTLLQDLVETARQKAAENKNLTLDDYTEIWIRANDLPPDIYKPGTEPYENLKKTIIPNYEKRLGYKGISFDEILNEFHGTVPPQLESLLKTLGINNDYSKFDGKILLVPHSQGNLYANTLYTYLTRNEKLLYTNIAIFGVATPASENPGYYIYQKVSDSYITSINDYVIKQVLLLATGILPPLSPNFHIDVHTSDILGHNFIDTYLSDPGAAEKIRFSIQKALTVFMADMADIMQLKSIQAVPREKFTVYFSYNDEVVVSDGKINMDSKIKDHIHYYIPLYKLPNPLLYLDYYIFLDLLPGKYGVHIKDNIYGPDFQPIGYFSTKLPVTVDYRYELNCSRANYCDPRKFSTGSSVTMRNIFGDYIPEYKSKLKEKLPEMFLIPGLVLIS